METLLAREILSPREFDQITQLAYRACGIDLKNGKQELVQARLGKKIRQGKFSSFQEYYEHVVADSTGEELIALLDALTTNFTSFLREATHFDFLRKTIVPGINGQIRIWSAACATGEEPFTIAFSLLEELGMPAASRIHILASDISSHALAAAERAAYTSERCQELPQEWLRKYLLRGSDRWEGWLRVKPAIRRMIEFRRLNLMGPFPSTGALSCHLLPQRDDLFQKGDASRARQSARAVPRAGRLSADRALRESQRARAPL